MNDRERVAQENRPSAESGDRLIPVNIPGAVLYLTSAQFIAGIRRGKATFRAR